MANSFTLRSITLLAILPMLGLPPIAPAQRHGRASRAAIVSLEKQWRQAALNEDTHSMDHLLSEDFLGIMADGQVLTKSQQIDWMKDRSLILTRLDVSDMKIKLISHHAAIVTSLAKVEGTIDGRPLDGSFRYTQVYQRVPADGWKITSFEATRVPNHLAEMTPVASH